MSDITRIVERAGDGRRPTVVLDLEQGATGIYKKARDSFVVTAPPKQRKTSAGPGRYSGGRTVGEKQDNGTVAMTILVNGATADVALANVEALIAELDEARQLGRLLEWRATGATHSSFFDLRGPGTWVKKYSSVQFSGAVSMEIELTVPVAPLVELDECDIWDDFAVDALADYTFDFGAASDLVVTGGAVGPAGSPTFERRMIHTARGWDYGDQEWTAKYTPAATITSFKGAVVVKRISATTYLVVYVDDDGTNSRLRIDKVVSGTPGLLQSTVLASRITAGQPFWVRGRIEGDTVYPEYFTGEPTPMGTPTLAPPGYSLTGADRTTFGAGVVGKGGAAWIPQHASATLDDLQGRPWTYRNRSLPEKISLRGAIPGKKAPAKADLIVTPSGGSAPPIFALIAWAKRPPPHNLVWNGDFPSNANGWYSSDPNNYYLNPGATLTWQNIASVLPAGRLSVVTGATASQGAQFRIRRRFKAGVTYTLRFYRWLDAGGAATLRWYLGAGDTSGNYASATSTLTGQWGQVTVTWTPTADTDSAFVSVATVEAVATTFYIDGVEVYEGTTAPTLSTQIEGRGAYPPFGVLEAESCDTGDLVSWAITADANYRSGQGLKFTTSGAGTAAAMWFIDPALLVADDFTLGDVFVEAWARVELASSLVSPKLTLSARPTDLNFGAERFTDEWGSAGKLLTKPSSGTVRRLVRLGVLPLLSSPGHPAVWKLRLAASWAAGSSGVFGVDQLLLSYAKRRALSPTSKINDASYPKFVASTNQTQRRIRHDLSGQVANPPANPFPHHGLGGQEILPPPGDLDVLVALSSLVPDDPTSDATTEQLAHSATVHLAVIPRGHLARG